MPIYALRRALALFDLDNFGPKTVQNLAREGRGDAVTEFENRNAAQWQAFCYWLMISPTAPHSTCKIQQFSGLCTET